MLKVLTRQFGHPQGPLGWAVGELMALKNGERSRWGLELLSLQAGERALEIGFGPGVDIRRLLHAAGPSGHVAGVDVSPLMHRRAEARSRAAVRVRQVDLRVGSAAELPFPDASFDAVFSANSAQFWPDLTQAAHEVGRVLHSSGRALVVVQPMWRGATLKDTESWRERLLDAFACAGFDDTQAELRALRPVSAVAVLARKACI